MLSATSRYSEACEPLGYSKWPSRRPPERRSIWITSSCVGTSCIFSPLKGYNSGCSTRREERQLIALSSSGAGPQVGAAGEPRHGRWRRRLRRRLDFLGPGVQPGEDHFFFGSLELGGTGCHACGSHQFV